MTDAYWVLQDENGADEETGFTLARRPERRLARVYRADGTEQWQRLSVRRPDRCRIPDYMRLDPRTHDADMKR